MASDYEDFSSDRTRWSPDRIRESVASDDSFDSSRLNDAQRQGLRRGREIRDQNEIQVNAAISGAGGLLGTGLAVMLFAFAAVFIASWAAVIAAFGWAVAIWIYLLRADFDFMARIAAVGAGAGLLLAPWAPWETIKAVGDFLGVGWMVPGVYLAPDPIAAIWSACLLLASLPYVVLLFRGPIIWISTALSAIRFRSMARSAFAGGMIDAFSALFLFVPVLAFLLVLAGWPAPGAADFDAARMAALESLFRSDAGAVATLLLVVYASLVVVALWRRRGFVGVPLALIPAYARAARAEAQGIVDHVDQLEIERAVKEIVRMLTGWDNRFAD